jgi:hypothetical protein
VAEALPVGVVNEEVSAYTHSPQRLCLLDWEVLMFLE